MIATVTVLAVVALTTWTYVLISAGGSGGVQACPAPAAGSQAGTVVERSDLAGVAPVPASAVSVRVLNAGGQRGQANLVSAQLQEYGFAEAAAPDNDPLFPDDDMSCVGQLRFGPAGQPAASTLTMVLPCVELVEDGRGDATVDVSVGTSFGDVRPSRAAQDVLDQLAAPAAANDGSANADPDATAAPAAPGAPQVDQATLQKAREVCGG